MAGKTAKEFPGCDLKLLTKVGQERLNRQIGEHDAYVEKKTGEYNDFMANKRTIFAARMEPRWAPTSNMGQQFEDFKSDPNNLFKTSLTPLD